MWTAAIQVAVSIMNKEEHIVFFCENTQRIKDKFRILTKIMERNSSQCEDTVVAVQTESCAVILSRQRIEEYLPENIYQHNNAKEKIITINSLVMDVFKEDAGVGNISTVKKLKLVYKIADWLLL